MKKRFPKKHHDRRIKPKTTHSRSRQSKEHISRFAKLMVAVISPVVVERSLELGIKILSRRSIKLIHITCPSLRSRRHVCSTMLRHRLRVRSSISNRITARSEQIESIAALEARREHRDSNVPKKTSNSWQKQLEILLDSPPSEVVFKEILRLFSTWPEDKDREKAILHARDRLEFWDECFCRISTSFSFLFENHKVAPWAILVKELSMNRRSWPNSNNEFRKLVTSPYLKQIRKLSLSRCELLEVGKLPTAPLLMSLQTLEISDTFSSENRAKIWRSPRLNTLDSLTIRNDIVGAQELESLGSGESALTLRKLRLERTFLDKESLKAFLLQKKLTSGLEVLDLRENNFRDLHARQIASAKHMNSLKILDLRKNKFTKKGKTTLRNARHLRRTNILF